MGIQINGSTDTISAIDGSLTLEGGELRTVSGLNVTGVVTATSYQGDGSALTGIDATQIVTGNTSVQTVDTGSDGHIKFNTEGSERGRFDNSGRLLVGTTSSFNNANTDSLKILAASTTSGGLGAGFYNFQNDSNWPGIALGRSRNNTVGSHTVVNSGDVLGNITFEGSDGTAFKRAAMIEGVVDATPGTNDMPGRLVFSTTADGASSPTERMRIDSTGAVIVGDGTTWNKYVSDAVFQITHDTNSKLVLNNPGNSSFSLACGTDNGLAFRNESTSAEAMRLDSDGRLLINGTTSQTWSGGAPLLQVSGTSASGTMHLGAFQYSNSSDGGELVLGSSRGTTVGSTTIVQNGDTLGRIRFCGADGVDFTNRGGEITCAVDGTPGSDDLPTRMMFYTASDGAGSPTERMRIQSSGSTQFQNTSEFYPNPDNSCSLGRSGNRWSAVWASNGTIQTSDERLKTEVADSSLASDFIKTLRPVSYKWIEGGKRHTGEYDEDNNWVYESTPGQRTHWGFIAQEVKQAADDAGVDFGGWVLGDKDDPESTQSLRYDQFIAPLTKALQEALAKIETLETANASQAATIAALDARLTALEGGN